MSWLPSFIVLVTLLLVVRVQRLVFIDYNSSFSVVGPATVEDGERITPHYDNVTYSTSINEPGSIHFRASQRFQNSSADDVILVLSPPGSVLSVTPESCAQALHGHRGCYQQVGTTCEYILSWNSPFSGALLVKYTAVRWGLRTGSYNSAELAIWVGFTSSSSSSAVGEADDHHYIGFYGQQLSAPVRPGHVYNLVNDNDVLMNAQFAKPVFSFWERVWGHVLDTRIDVLAITTAQGDQLRIASGEEFGRSPINSSSITVYPVSEQSLIINARAYQLVVENKDTHLDLGRIRWPVSRTVFPQHPEGLLGRTLWETIGSSEDAGVDVEQYRERDENVFGCNAAKIRFHCEAPPLRRQGEGDRR